MQVVSDTQAQAIIASQPHVGFYIHTGTQPEVILINRLKSFVRNKPSLLLFELPKENIKDPYETLFAFVRFPRLLLFRDQNTELDLTGMKAINQWLQKL